MADNEDLEKEFSREIGILDSEERILEGLEKIILQRRALERKLEEELKITHVPDEILAMHERKEMFLEHKEQELRKRLSEIGTKDTAETRRIDQDMKR